MKAVGKTCLLNKYIDGIFEDGYDMTLGVGVGLKVVTVNGKKIQIQIWDTAGSESFKSITSQYYKKSIGDFIVYDITSKKTFEEVDNWFKKLQKVKRSDLVITLVGNKWDQEDEYKLSLHIYSRQVSTDEGAKKAEELKFDFIETSAKEGTHVDECFRNATEKVYKKIEERLIDITNESVGVTSVKNPTSELSSFSEEKKKKGFCSKC